MQGWRCGRRRCQGQNSPRVLCPKRHRGSLQPPLLRPNPELNHDLIGDGGFLKTLAILQPHIARTSSFRCGPFPSPWYSNHILLVSAFFLEQPCGQMMGAHDSNRGRAGVVQGESSKDLESEGMACRHGSSGTVLCTRAGGLHVWEKDQAGRVRPSAVWPTHISGLGTPCFGDALLMQEASHRFRFSLPTMMVLPSPPGVL